MPSCPAVGFIPDRPYPPKAFQIFGQQKPEGLRKMKMHLAHPLGDQSFGSDNQCAADHPPELKLPHNESGLNSLSETYLIGQKIAHPVL